MNIFLTNIKSVVIKNKAVFLIGLIMLVFFVVLIATAQIHKPTQIPNLIKINEDDISTSRDLETNNNTSFGSIQQNSDTATVVNTEQTTQENSEINDTGNTGEANYSKDTENMENADDPDTIQINFTGTKFVPRTVTANLMQVVKWNNISDKDIVLRQANLFYSEFQTPITIAPGTSYRQRMYKVGWFSYQDINSDEYGSIFITGTSSN